MSFRLPTTDLIAPIVMQRDWAGGMAKEAASGSDSFAAKEAAQYGNGLRGPLGADRKNMDRF